MKTKVREDEIVEYIEPIFNFCVRRLNTRHDAEDLASEIMVHVLNGVQKYEIDSLEKWVWRIARNRYARFVDARNKRGEQPSENDFADVQDDYDFVDALMIADEYQRVFRYLHTLSSEYRNILVDYYIGELPVKQIAENYALSETTVKWRLNVSREKIKTRIKNGENNMSMMDANKVYKHINWNTGLCNGSMDPNKYLHSQIARAICAAAYEKPLTVEEISLKTGLPTMYIEDELPRLIYGDAIVEEGKKYAANFIVLRLCDRAVMQGKFAPLVADIGDYFADLFKSNEAGVAKMGFYGADFMMKRLGYIAMPMVLRGKIGKAKDSLDMPDGPYPPRQDGGYGWFIVAEHTEEESSDFRKASADGGCNLNGDETDFIYWYWLSRYFGGNVYHNGGTSWLAPKKIVRQAQDNNDIIPDGALSEDDIIRLIKTNLVIKDGGKYKFNFACFTREQFDAFRACFDKSDAKLDKMLVELIADIHKSFKAFVPKRLNSQINQWVSSYANNIIGFVAEELIGRGVLETPDPTGETALTNGVFSILGECVDV